jgi:hypothetical protein
VGQEVSPQKDPSIITAKPNVEEPKSPAVSTKKEPTRSPVHNTKPVNTPKAGIIKTPGKTPKAIMPKEVKPAAKPANDY